jgi:trk system potassium uptake protein TrkA
MFVVIVGAGTVGTCLIDIAVREKNSVVVVELDAARAAEISRGFDVTVLNADATVVETLREAAAGQADALVATTGDDAINLMAVSIAAELGIPSVVSIVNEKGHSSFFRRLGAIVMENPEEIVATHLYNTLKRPRFQYYNALADGAQLFQLELHAKSTLVGRTVRDTVKKERLPASLRVLAITRLGKAEIVGEDTVLRQGDLVTFYSIERVPDALISKLIG